MVAADHPNPNQWWYHRRLMAYFSLACLAALLLGMFGNRIPEPMLPLAQTLAWVFSVNLLYYYGGNAVEYLKDRK
ncbi:hypothetical protein C7436_1056 [Marinobacter nauticus]|nr:hypothetical protein C7436_1056 [Marinobacter nauticus]